MTVVGLKVKGKTAKKKKTKTKIKSDDTMRAFGQSDGSRKKVFLKSPNNGGAGLMDLTGKHVIVETAETLYEGNLVEIGEDEVHLESDLGWIVIPLERVTSIREKD